MIMEWLRKAPTAVTIAVVIVCGFLALGILAAYVILTLDGAETTEFRQWILTIGVTVLLPLLGVNTIASVQAARSASNTEDQSNGLLSERDRTIAQLRAELERRGGA